MRALLRTSYAGSHRPPAPQQPSQRPSGTARGITGESHLIADAHTDLDARHIMSEYGVRIVPGEGKPEAARSGRLGPNDISL